MDCSRLLRGLVIGIAVAAPIGPVNVLCMHRTLAHGRLTGFASGLGAALADALFGAIAAFGLTAVAAFLLTILSFVAIFAGAGLARPEGDYRGASVLVLGVFLGSALWWLSLSTVVGLVRHKLERGGLVWINRGSGALIFAFGVAAWASLAAGL